MNHSKNQYVPNPLIYADIPDPDIIRVGDTFYMSSTTMYFSPGCPIMKSTDLIHWRTISYVYDTLEDTDALALRNGKNAYGRGSWASSLRYHDGKFYVLFMSFTTNKSYIYETEDIEHGKWTCHTFATIFYDASLLFDEDGHIYVVSSSDGNFLLTELTSDLKSINPNGPNLKKIASTEITAGLKGEGVHIQKINGYYYLFAIAWPQNSMRTEYCFRSKSIEGPYEKRIVLQDEGVAQGGIIDTIDRNWYGLLFKDHGAAGRTPVLVPVFWKDGWPLFGVNGKVPHNMVYPIAINKNEDTPESSIVTSDTFDEATLPLEWQWNHNPDINGWSLTEKKGVLRLKNTSISKTFTQTKNMLTQRTIGPYCSGLVCVDTNYMKNGDIAGIAALQAKYGFIAVKQELGEKYIILITTNENAAHEFMESETARVELLQEIVFLKIHFDFIKEKAIFYYSLDNTSWSQMGEPLSLVYSLKHFTGYRFALFNRATEITGGFVDFDSFSITNE